MFLLQIESSKYMELWSYKTGTDKSRANPSDSESPESWPLNEFL